MSRPRILALALLGVGLAGVSLATGGGAFFDQVRVVQGRGDDQPVRDLTARLPQGGVSLPESVAMALTLALVAGAIVALLGALLYARFGLPGVWRSYADVRIVEVEPQLGGAPRPTRAALVEHVDAALDAIEQGTDPREVIIACYVALLDAVRAAGTRPDPSESPAELLYRVLAEQEIPNAPVVRLSELYVEARFSQHVVADEMRDDARAALRTVRATLGVTV